MEMLRRLSERMVPLFHGDTLLPVEQVPPQEPDIYVFFQIVIHLQLSEMMVLLLLGA